MKNEIRLIEKHGWRRVFISEEDYDPDAPLTFKNGFDGVPSSPVNGTRLYGHTIVWFGSRQYPDGRLYVAYISAAVFDQRDTKFTEQEFIEFLQSVGVDNSLENTFAASGLVAPTHLTYQIRNSITGDVQDMSLQEPAVGIGVFDDGTIKTLMPQSTLTINDGVNEPWDTMQFTAYVRRII